MVCKMTAMVTLWQTHQDFRVVRPSDFELLLIFYITLVKLGKIGNFSDFTCHCGIFLQFLEL
jgi:hypothetical protein